ncbi:hypothetical protein EIK77_005161 [Talaromyces pinophilus]|nr:hypothetical protein EIK77_005161 [Talaromyces pinophilus]
MRDNIKKGVNLQTNTVAIAIIQSKNHRDKWVVKTERGDIECSEVVHASNAYSSALEPSLRGLITPCPHMCNKVVPPKDSKNLSSLKGSYGILLGQDNLITINPRLNGDGAILFGGSNPGQDDFWEWLEKNPYRYIDDSMTGFNSISKAIHEFAVEELKGWSTEDIMRQEETYKHAWSGILGLVSIPLSPEGHPDLR